MTRFRDDTVAGASSRIDRGSSTRSLAQVERATIDQKGKHIAVKRAIYRSYHFRYIYIGNLPVNVTEEQLTAFCGRAGEVFRVTIRSVSGSVCSVQAADSALSDESRLYASVEFKSSFAAGRALRLDGTVFNKSRVVITQDALKLPEFQDLQRRCQAKNADIDSPKTMLGAMQSHWNALRRITMDRTQVIHSDYVAEITSKGHYRPLLQPAPRKLRLMGHSIANTIA